MAKKIELKKLRDPKTDQQNPHIYALLCPLEKTNTCTLSYWFWWILHSLLLFNFYIYVLILKHLEFSEYQTQNMLVSASSSAGTKTSPAVQTLVMWDSLAWKYSASSACILGTQVGKALQRLSPNQQFQHSYITTIIFSLLSHSNFCLILQSIEI